MSHPDPNAPPDLTPIQVGESFENPVTGERATVLELPWANPEGRAVAEMIGLARLGHTNAKGMPHPLQMALFAGEFSDVIDFRSPPPAVQRAIFGALAPVARRRGYRATYPQISRTSLAPRPKHTSLAP